MRTTRAHHWRTSRKSLRELYAFTVRKSELFRNHVRAEFAEKAEQRFSLTLQAKFTAVTLYEPVKFFHYY